MAALAYSNWADEGRPWLLNQTWRVLPLAELVVEGACAGKVHWKEFFVRPDSPLKQFSGRIVDRDTLTPKDFDFGLYFDEPQLPVVIAPNVCFLNMPRSIGLIRVDSRAARMAESISK